MAPYWNAKKWTKNHPPKELQICPRLTNIKNLKIDSKVNEYNNRGKTVNIEI